MKKREQIDDGKVIEWVDSETIRFIDNDRSALIWMDYEPGLFKRGRIVRSDSIQQWEARSIDDNLAVSDNEKNALIDHVLRFFEAIGVPCRVEP
jgi:hypothetical protein